MRIVGVPSSIDPAALLINIMENAAIGFLLISMDGILMHATETFCRMIGYSADELIGTVAEELIHPDDRASVSESFDQMLAGRTRSYQLERRYIRKDGTVLYALGAASLHRDGKTGEPQFAVIQITDISHEKEAEAKIARLHERLQLAIGASRAGVWDVDFSVGKYVWDSRMHELYGLKGGEFSGDLADWEKMIHPADVGGIMRKWHETVGRSPHYDAEYRICRPNGEIRHIHALVQIVADADGKPLRAVGTSWDITEHKQLAEAIFEEKERLHITLASIGDAVICTDALANITFMNPIAEKLTGWPAAEGMGKPIADVFKTIEESTGDPAANPVGQCFRSEASYYRSAGIFLLNRQGDAYDIQLSAAPVRRADGEMIGSVVVFQDISALRAAQRTINHNAHHDALTGLPNRPEFMTKLTQAIEEARAGATGHVLCFIDLDRFKIVNDMGGHAAGDALLKEVAKVIALRCSRKDVPARLGGDEFGLILRNVGLSEAEVSATILVDTIRDMEFRWQDQVFRIGASVGMIEITADSGDGVLLLHKADLACYRAKSSGRNQVSVFGEGDSDGADLAADERGRAVGS